MVLCNNDRLFWFTSPPSIDQTAGAGITTAQFGNCRNEHLTRNRGRICTLRNYLEKQVSGIAETCYFISPDHNNGAVHFYGPKPRYRVRGATEDIVSRLTPDGRIICLAHCSHHTITAGVVEKALRDVTTFGRVMTNKLHVLIYGGICQNCYEVGEDVKQALGRKYRDFFVQNGHPDKYNLSLAGVLEQKLAENAISKNRIRTVRLCPHCHSPAGRRVLFSHRRGDKERNMVFMYAYGQMLAGTTGDCPYLMIFSD